MSEPDTAKGDVGRRPRPSETWVAVSTRLDPDSFDMLARLSLQRRESMSGLVRLAVLQLLARHGAAVGPR